MESELCHRLATFHLETLKSKFQEQDEFLAIEHFLPSSILDRFLVTLPSLESSINRNYIPAHKKGGSISRFDLDRLAPTFGQFYYLPPWFEFLREIAAQHLLPCPNFDPHTYALYYYTEPGDHIGYHYDKSYYQGKRYTVLLGLVDRSSCQLEYQLYRDDPHRETQSHRLSLRPGTLVLFNGDKLYHRVTPLAENEQRIVLTLEYVTDPRMNSFNRFVSNLKDSIAYFGFRQVFR